MKCLETRVRRNGLVYRQYEAANGDRHSTYEIPVSVVKAIGVKKLGAALATWVRGQAQRQRAAQVRAAVLAQPSVKATALANELRITEARVRQIRKEASCP